MGITGGIMIASSATASQAANTQNSQQLLAHNCGSKTGCGGGNIAYQPHGCGAQNTMSQPNGCGAQGNIAYQPHGCGASQPQTNFYNDPNQMQGQPPSQSCSAPPRPNNGQTGAQQPANSKQQARGNSQWEMNNSMADTGKNSNQMESIAGEAQLLSQLNDEGKAIYRGLDPAGKELAIKLASQQQDKNQAVKMAAQKMAEKRANTNAPKYY